MIIHINCCEAYYKLFIKNATRYYYIIAPRTIVRLRRGFELLASVRCAGKVVCGPGYGVLLKSDIDNFHIEYLISYTCIGGTNTSD